MTFAVIVVRRYYVQISTPSFVFFIGMRVESLGVTL